LSKQSICAEMRPSSAWGSLRPPSDRDVHGPRKRHKGLDSPPPLLDYILVMDFEWTADDKSRMEPISEITQLPAVVMKLEDRKWGAKCLTSNTIEKDSPIPLPIDLSIPSFSNRIVNADAYAITAFDTFVRPTLNPTLTQFSIDLTGITQQDVNDAPAINVAVHNFMQWLESLDLVDSKGMRKGNWCFATWGDGDIMSTLRQELEFKSLNLPPCFDRWINLKHDSMFKKHYGREPRGGLRACVESIGAIWSGRAHDGLVDSLNTAKIVRHMVQTGFRFTRPTRGLDKHGLPFGAQKRQHRYNTRIE
jgi:inhibitor of KinA sporulation pathway (predicted exonuclease)